MLATFYHIDIPGTMNLAFYRIAAMHNLRHTQLLCEADIIVTKIEEHETMIVKIINCIVNKWTRPWHHQQPVLYCLIHCFSIRPVIQQAKP